MIKLSKKWDYWLKAITHIASKNWELLKIKDIAKTLSISESLLRRIISDFEKSGLISTKKWRNWWVFIDRDLSKITLYDILFSMWEDLTITDCTWWTFCKNEKNCITTDILKSLQKWFNSILKMYTLNKFLK